MVKKPPPKVQSILKSPGKIGLREGAYKTTHSILCTQQHFTPVAPLVVVVKIYPLLLLSRF